MGRLAWRRMGLGSGFCRRLRPGICLGCRTRLGLGPRLGEPLLVRGRSELRLGTRPRLALRWLGAAPGLALLVISQQCNARFVQKQTWRCEFATSALLSNGGRWLA